MVQDQLGSKQEPGHHQPPYRTDVHQREGIEQDIAVARASAIRHDFAIENPVIVIAWHALGPRLGSTGPADRQHLAAGHRICGHMAPCPRGFGGRRAFVKPVRPFGEQQQFGAAGRCCYRTALLRMVEPGEGRDRHEEAWRELFDNEFQLMRAIGHRDRGQHGAQSCAGEK